MDPSTIMMLASLASAGAGAAGVGNKGGGQGFAPYEVLKLPTFGGTDTKFSTQNNFLTDQIAGMMGGQALPPILRALLQQIQSGLSEQNKRQFFGSPGDRSGSIMDSARNTGAAMGVGPKATMAQVGKQLGNYSNAEKMIMDHISSLGMNAGASWMGNILNASNQTPMGPPAQVVGGGAYNVPASNPFGDMSKAMMTAAPWMSGGALNPTQTASSAITPYFTGTMNQYTSQPGYIQNAQPATRRWDQNMYSSQGITDAQKIKMAEDTAKYGGIFRA